MDLQNDEHDVEVRSQYPLSSGNLNKRRRGGGVRPLSLGDSIFVQDDTDFYYHRLIAETRSDSEEHTVTKDICTETIVSITKPGDVSCIPASWPRTQAHATVASLDE